MPESLFNKVAGLKLAQMFSCEFYKISKNSFSYRIPLMDVSDTTMKFLENFPKKI